MRSITEHQEDSFHTAEREKPAYCKDVHQSWKFTPRLYNKAEKITGCIHVQLLKGTQQISENAPCRQKWHIAYIYSRAVLVQSKWSRRGTERDVLFAFLPIRMPVCERDCACQRIHVYTYVCAGGRLCPTGRMSRASAAEGGQLSGFVLSMGHHLILAQSRDRDGASETTATNCSLSVRQMGGRGSCRRGLRRACRGPSHFHSGSVDLQWNTNVYNPKCAQENHLFPGFPFYFFPSICLALYFCPLSFLIALWCNTRPCAATTGSLELTNPCEGSPGSYKPSPGLPTWGSVLWMFPWGPRRRGGGTLEG